MATRERYIIESMFMIADKEGKDVPFKLNSAQSQLDDNFTGRDIIPKARQEGISSYYIARGLAKCLSVRNTNAVIVAHEDKATKKMLKKAHYMVNHMLGAKPVIKNSSANEITFPKMGSSLSIGTAGSDNVGVGDTIHFLHCSEVALWKNPKALLTGLFQAVPKHGEIGLESTGRGQGNYYHRAAMRAAAGRSRYRLHFFNWQSFSEYSYDLTPEMEREIMANLNPEWEELEIVEKYGITPGQLAWRRDKIEELDYDLTRFQQEYPMTLDECFQATGSSIFAKINYRETKDWEKVDTHLHVLKGHPNPYYSYVAGVDVGGGVGQDNSIIEVVCLNTMEQVAEYANDKIDPDVLGHKAAALGKKFNNAFLIVENNNYGISTLKELSRPDVYPSYLLYKKIKPSGIKEEVDKLTDLGFRTSVKSKPFAVGKFRSLVRDELLIYSPLLKDEMNSFIETETGQLQAEEGCYDDRVMAMAMLSVGIDKALLYAESAIVLPQHNPTVFNDPFSLDSIIKQLHSRGSGYAVSDQTGVDNSEYIDDF